MAPSSRAAAVLASALGLVAAAPGAPVVRAAPVAPAVPAAPAEASGSLAPGASTLLALDRRSPLAEGPEIARRLLSPTTHDRLLQAAAARGAPRLHTIAIGEARVELRLPAGTPPPGGWALLVFVMPGDAMPMPPGWARVLDEAGVAYASPRDAGNTHGVLDRRVPLALHAHAMALASAPIDPSRVYVGGFSGGSRVAQRIGEGYADVFHGMLLVGGSDPVGQLGHAPPPAPQLALLQERSRVVFATGGGDLPNRGRDGRTREALAALCVTRLANVGRRGIGHWTPDARGLARALEALEAVPSPDPGLPACRARLEAAIEQGLAGVDAAIAAGDWVEAGARLGALDDRYGGAVADRSVPLARRIAAELATRGVRFEAVETPDLGRR